MVEVPEELYHYLKRAMNDCRRTDGVFDITVGSLLRAYDGTDPSPAEIIEALDLKTVLVERDEDLAHEASDVLRNTMVIRGEVTDQDLLEHEGIGKISTFVAVTPDGVFRTANWSEEGPLTKEAVTMKKISMIITTSSIGVRSISRAPSPLGGRARLR